MEDVACYALQWDHNFYIYNFYADLLIQYEVIVITSISTYNI